MAGAPRGGQEEKREKGSCARASGRPSSPTNCQRATRRRLPSNRGARPRFEPPAHKRTPANRSSHERNRSNGLHTRRAAQRGLCWGPRTTCDKEESQSNNAGGYACADATRTFSLPSVSLRPASRVAFWIVGGFQMDQWALDPRRGCVRLQPDGVDLAGVEWRRCKIDGCQPPPGWVLDASLSLSSSAPAAPRPTAIFPPTPKPPRRRL